jgi:hypothetical protein
MASRPARSKTRKRLGRGQAQVEFAVVGLAFFLLERVTPVAVLSFA